MYVFVCVKVSVIRKRERLFFCASVCARDSVIKRERMRVRVPEIV